MERSDTETFTVLGLAAAILVTVVMSSGLFTFVDSIVGFMIFVACLIVDNRHLPKGPLKLLFNVTAGGGLYLMLGVFLEVFLASNAPHWTYECTERSLIELCRGAPFALLWIICAVVARPVQTKIRNSIKQDL